MNPTTQEHVTYKLYLTDVMGTTTPKKEITDVTNFILGSESVQREVGQRTGTTNIVDVITKGLARSAKGEKDHPEFKAYIKLWDVGAQIAYQSGAVKMSLESGVEEAFEQIHRAECRIMVYSSGAVETSKLGMKSNGLDRLIVAYFSSSQKEIGSKFEAHAYREIARQAGVDLKDMVYVTDDIKEAQAAVEAGTGQVFLIDPRATQLGEKEGYVLVNNYKQVAEQTVKKDQPPAEGQKAEA